MFPCEIGKTKCVSSLAGYTSDDVFFFVASIDEDICDCQVPCVQTRYNSEVSYSRFPDPGTAYSLIVEGYYENEQYQR